VKGGCALGLVKGWYALGMAQYVGGCQLSLAPLGRHHKGELCVSCDLACAGDGDT
jgi:hypothetical protein